MTMFQDEIPKSREVDKLSAEVETVCCDWHRMRAVILRIAGMPWWDLHTLCCHYCHAPFEVSDGTCQHQIDCVYERCCEIVGARPMALPNAAILSEWQKQSTASVPR